MPEPITEPPVSVTATPPHEATGRSPYADPVLDDRMAAILARKLPPSGWKSLLACGRLPSRWCGKPCAATIRTGMRRNCVRQVVQRMSHGAV